MMSNADLSPEERTARGKRLLIYGMFALVVVTVVAVFLTTWLIMAPLGLTSQAITITLVMGAVSIIACVIVWFIYTKLILKE
jgi:hypothetical protein